MKKMDSSVRNILEGAVRLPSLVLNYEDPTLPEVVQASPTDEPNKLKLAFDSAPIDGGVFNSIPIIVKDQQFKGYAYLASLYQNGIIGSIVDVLSSDSTREGIELYLDEDEGDSEERLEQLEILNKRLDELKLTSALKDAMIKNLLFGGSLLYYQIGDTTEGEELAVPLRLSEVKISKREKYRLTRLVSIEPYFCVPLSFNAVNPISPDWYNPEYTMVIGQKIHRSRYERVVYNKAPVMYLPKYNFFGIPLVQQVEEYVLRFEKTTTYINEIMQRMRTMVLKTNLGDFSEDSGKEQSEMLAEAQSFNARLSLMAEQGSNIGIAVIDQETEDLTELNSSLSELANIMSSMAEQMCIVPKIPATRLLGISPQGMNATGESDMKNYYNTIAQIQEYNLRGPIQKVLDILCVEQFGEIDHDIKFRFRPLQSLGDQELSELRNSEINQVSALFSAGLITKEEARSNLSKNEMLNLIIDKDADLSQTNTDDPEFIDEEKSVDVMQDSRNWLERLMGVKNRKGK